MFDEFVVGIHESFLEFLKFGERFLIFSFFNLFFCGIEESIEWWKIFGFEFFDEFWFRLEFFGDGFAEFFAIFEGGIELFLEVFFGWFWFFGFGVVKGELANYVEGAFA